MESYAKHGSRRHRCVSSLNRYFHRALRWRVTNCVAHNILDGAAQHFRYAGHGASVGVNNLNRAVVSARFKVTISRDLLHEIRQVERFSLVYIDDHPQIARISWVWLS